VKRRWLIFLVFGLLFAIGAGNRPVLTPGIYPVQPGGDGWDQVVFDKKSNYRPGIKYFTAIQPSDVRLELPKERFASFSFGRFSLGNAGTEYTMVIGSQNRYFFDTLYIDLDRDGVITAREEVKMNERQSVALGYTVQELDAEARLTVAYRTSTGKIVEHPLDIRLIFYYGKFSDEPMVFYMVQNTTFLQGTGLLNGKPLSFALVDGDGNGRYNDWGDDFLFYDKNGDGKYHFGKESQVLNPLHDLKIGQNNGIYRLIVPVFPAKIGLIAADADYKMADFE